MGCNLHYLVCLQNLNDLDKAKNELNKYGISTSFKGAGDYNVKLVWLVISDQDTQKKRKDNSHFYVCRNIEREQIDPLIDCLQRQDPPVAPLHCIINDSQKLVIGKTSHSLYTILVACFRPRLHAVMKMTTFTMSRSGELIYLSVHSEEGESQNF